MTQYSLIDHIESRIRGPAGSLLASLFAETANLGIHGLRQLAGEVIDMHPRPHKRAAGIRS